MIIDGENYTKNLKIYYNYCILILELLKEIMNNVICPDCGSENSRYNSICEQCSSNLKLNDKYYLLKILGENIGITYLAEKPNNTELAGDELKRTVKLSVNNEKLVIKELSLRTLEKWKTEELFKRESEILSQLNYKSIPKFIEEFELGIGRNAKSYIVMEYIDGTSLREEFENKRYTEDEVIELILEIAKILNYLHSLRPPVIHRDIKLSNIMRKSDGSLAIIDFGSVKNINMNKNATVSGTYGFMAPEQLKGEATFASDFYSLGVIALVLLSRKEPEDMVENNLELNWQENVYASNKLMYLLENLLNINPKKRISSLREIENIINDNNINYTSKKDTNNNNRSNTSEKTDNSSDVANVFKEEFKRIDGEFTSISDENNYKQWKGNLDAVLGFGMFGALGAGWYYQTWYWGIIWAIVFVVVFMVLTGSWYKKRATKFLKILLEKVDKNYNRELTFAVLLSWAEKHDLGDEFIDALNKFIKKEIANKAISFEKLNEYKEEINESFAYKKFTESYMKEMYPGG